MAITAILGKAFQMVLMFLGTADMICQRQDLHNDLISVFPAGDKGFCFLEMLCGSAVQAGPVFLSDIDALLVETVRVDDLKQMCHEVGDRGEIFIKDDLYTFHVAVV